MASLTVIIKPAARDRRVRVEMNAEEFERVAASLGFFNPEFLKGLNRAERDYKAGRVKKIKSLKELRN